MMDQGKVTNERAPGTFTLFPVGIFVLVTLAGWWVATQWLARRLAYQGELGEPWLFVAGWRFYPPWKVIAWNYWYHAYAPAIFNRAIFYVFAAIIVGVIAVILYAVWLARRVRIATTWVSLNKRLKSPINSVKHRFFTSTNTSPIPDVRSSNTARFERSFFAVSCQASKFDRSGRQQATFSSITLPWTVRAF
jgi:hypothetical protein